MTALGGGEPVQAERTAGYGQGGRSKVWDLKEDPVKRREKGAAVVTWGPVALGGVPILL